MYGHGQRTQELQRAMPRVFYSSEEDSPSDSGDSSSSSQSGDDEPVTADPGGGEEEKTPARYHPGAIGEHQVLYSEDINPGDPQQQQIWERIVRLVPEELREQFVSDIEHYELVRAGKPVLTREGPADPSLIISSDEEG
jgi:hypothetical protein